MPTTGASKESELMVSFVRTVSVVIEDLTRSVEILVAVQKVKWLIFVIIPRALV